MLEFKKKVEIEETKNATVQAIITEQDGTDKRICDVRIEGNFRNIEIGVRTILRGFVIYLKDEDIRKAVAFEVIANYCIDAINNAYGAEETENDELCVAYNDLVDINQMEE